MTSAPLVRKGTPGAVLVVVLLLPGLAVAEGAQGEAADTAEARGSIYRISWAVDIPVVAAGAIGTSVPFLMSSELVDTRCPCDRSHINALDRLAVGLHSAVADTIGNVGVAVAVAAPVALELLTVHAGRTLVEDLTVFAEVMAVNGGLVTLSKFIVQRPTPRTYEGDAKLVSSPGGYLSFYSGHTSFTFASLSYGAVTLGARNQQFVWPWIVTGVVGGGVATVMVLGGAHFPTDVAMGALAGSAIGIAIPLLHRRGPKRPGLALLPGPEGRGLAVQGRF
jgi:membrane-associated phospholipid phosphatase